MQKRIAIHGLGYVGLTAAVHWARAGWTVIAYDPDVRTIERLRAGQPRAGEFLGYLDADVKELVRPDLNQTPPNAGCIVPTTNFDDVLYAQVQSIAVPTEKDGEPYDDIVVQLVENLLCRLLAADAPLDILVESTLTPGTIDRVLETCAMSPDDIGAKTLAVCPRRDWFASRDSHLGAMKRIVGGVNAQSTQRAIALLSIVSNDIVGTDYRTAEVTKALENSLLHAAVALPTELAMNMRDRNVADALALATTHPRLMQLFIGAGSGGRCIPLGPKYLNELNGPHSLLENALMIDKTIRMKVAESVAQRGCKTALVCGIAYRPDFRDAGLSPGLAVAQHLRRSFAIETTVHDPMWTKEELENLTGFPVETRNEAECMRDYDALVVATPHTLYLGWPLSYTHEESRLRYVLDAQGAWKTYTMRHLQIEYQRVGTPGWLK